MIQIYLVKLGGREDTFFSVFLFFCLFLFSFVFALFCVVKIVFVFLCIVFVVKIFKNEIMSYTITKKGLILLIFMIVYFRFWPNLSSENIYFLVNQCDSCSHVFNFVSPFTTRHTSQILCKLVTSYFKGIQVEQKVL